MIFKHNTVLVDSKDNSKIAESDIGLDQEFVPLMSLIPLLPRSRMLEVLKEYQFYFWNRRTTFCGVCGRETDYDSSDNCKVCPCCNERFYPAQFPAVIVSIVKDDKILLVHNRGFSGEMYSVIAGFVDLGESLEECVRRDIREEVGLEVKNIRYFSSQNWGFTSSLMIAFTAEYESGEIKIDDVEIDDAAWFSRDNLPEIPPDISVARTLIDNFIKKPS